VEIDRVDWRRTPPTRKKPNLRKSRSKGEDDEGRDDNADMHSNSLDPLSDVNTRIFEIFTSDDGFNDGRSFAMQVVQGHDVTPGLSFTCACDSRKRNLLTLSMLPNRPRPKTKLMQRSGWSCS
jgi:hypothetical protein